MDDQQTQIAELKRRIEKLEQQAKEQAQQLTAAKKAIEELEKAAKAPRPGYAAGKAR